MDTNQLTLYIKCFALSRHRPIINLLNGSGKDLIPNLLQLLYAPAAGFMFVIAVCKALLKIKSEHKI